MVIISQGVFPCYIIQYLPPILFSNYIPTKNKITIYLLIESCRWSYLPLYDDICSSSLSKRPRFKFQCRYVFHWCALFPIFTYITPNHTHIFVPFYPITIPFYLSSSVIYVEHLMMYCCFLTLLYMYSYLNMRPHSHMYHIWIPLISHAYKPFYVINIYHAMTTLYSIISSDTQTISSFPHIP